MNQIQKGKISWPRLAFALLVVALTNIVMVSGGTKSSIRSSFENNSDIVSAPSSMLGGETPKRLSNEERRGPAHILANEKYPSVGGSTIWAIDPKYSERIDQIIRHQKQWEENRYQQPQSQTENHDFQPPLFQDKEGSRSLASKLCSCSPRSFTVTLDLSSTCNVDTIQSKSGISFTICSIEVFDKQSGNLLPNGNNIPQSVTSVTMIEMNSSGEVINVNDQYTNVNFGNGESFRLESISNELPLSSSDTNSENNDSAGAVSNERDEATGELPPIIGNKQPISTIRSNASEKGSKEYIPTTAILFMVGQSPQHPAEEIISTFVWIYSNSCDGITITNGDKYSWNEWSDVEEQAVEYCPIHASDMPSGMPSISSRPSASGAPSEAPSESPSVTMSGAPSAIPSGVPSEMPSQRPVEVPSPVPSVEPTLVQSTRPSFAPSRTASEDPSIGPSSTPSSVYQPLIIGKVQRQSSSTTIRRGWCWITVALTMLCLGF